MYRALTWWFMTEHVDPTDTDLIAARAAEPSVEVSTDPDDPWTRVNGGDVSSEIRTQEVSARVSAVARVPAVREHLIAQQRAIIAAADPGVVAEGRDIGTVVATAAQLKVFLTADPGARARRRAAELSADAGETEASQARRDRLDAAQSEMAADALLLDATDLTLDEVIEKITRLARERGAGLFAPEGAELVGLPGQGHEDKGSWAWAGDQSS
jgi:cytidylate kinase